MDGTVKIGLIFNPLNEETKRFLSHLKDDISKCFNRFSIQIQFLEDKEFAKADFSFVLASKNDWKDEQYVKTCEPTLKKDNSFLFQIDQINQKEIINYIQNSITFSFWDIIPETGEILLYRNDNPKSIILYWEKLTDIVFEIKQKHFAKRKEKNETIYLALTDSSQKSDWDNIKRDLADLNFDIVPDRLLSFNQEKCSESIENYLSDSKFAIHMIPSVYTIWFKPTHLSMVEHQCNITADHIKNKDNNFHRIIWLPSDIEITDEQNQIFIEKIQRDTKHNINTTILKCNLEDLKKEYRNKLKDEKESSKENKAELPDVYIISDANQSIVIDELKKSLNGNKILIKDNFSGISYNEHLKFLANSKIVILHYTDENSPWLNVKVNDILKSPGLGMFQPFTKKILLKESKDLNTEEYAAQFTEILVGDINKTKAELTKLIIQN